VHPSLLPHLLRNALLGPGALGRLQRFLTAAEHPSLTATARTLGCHSSTLTTQMASLEAASGGPLFHRTATGSLPTGLQLTHLGEQLRQQAKDHLQIIGVKPAALAGLPQPLQTVLGPAHGKGRLERFLAITEHHTLTAAANTLGTSPNVLSTQMQKLQTTCGAALWHRNTHNESLGGHNLTPLGHRLREQARQHLNQPASPDRAKADHAT
jgi:DNA-binding transcriptional LysR family regulator